MLPVPEWPRASVARTVKRKLAGVIGVPKTTPVGSRVRPVGKAPLATDQVYGAVPDLACKGAEYGAPTTTRDRDVVVTTGGTTAGKVGPLGGDVTGAVTTSVNDLLTPPATVVAKGLLTRSLYDPAGSVRLKE